MMKNSAANDPIQDNEIRAYELIANAISPGSKVEVTDTQVHIHTSQLTAQEIEQILADPEKIRHALSKYVFTPSNNAADVNTGIGIQSGILERKLALRSKAPQLPYDFLKGLFADKVLKELGLYDITPDQLQEVDGNLVYKIEDYAITELLWEARIKMLRKILRNAEFAGIERVFCEATPLQLTKEEPITSDLDRILPDIIGVKEGHFYLNKMYLLNRIFAPEVTGTVTTDGEPMVSINKRHLCDYLGQVFGDIVIPNQPHQADTEHLVTPVIIPVSVPNSLNKRNLYSFLIDVSTSLKSVENSYKEQITAILEKLIAVIKDTSGAYLNPKDTIRLVFFSSKDQQLIQKDFLVKDLLNNIEDLKHAIISAQINGKTYLDGTIVQQLAELDAWQTDQDDCNVNMFILTDGEDNQSSAEEKALLEKQGNKFRNQETTLIPKFRIFRVDTGTGNPDEIKAIADGLDADVYKANVDELEQVFNQIRDINVRRYLVQFVQGEKKASLPVYEGRLTVGPTIDTTQSVQLKGKTYTVGQAPLATNTAKVGIAQQQSIIGWLWEQSTMQNLKLALTTPVAAIQRRVFNGPS